MPSMISCHIILQHCISLHYKHVIPYYLMLVFYFTFDTRSLTYMRIYDYDRWWWHWFKDEQHVRGSSDHTKTSKAVRKNEWSRPCRNWMRLALNCERSPYGIGTNAHQVYILVEVYHREMSFSWAQQRLHWETDEFLSLGLVFPTTPPQGNTKTPKNSCACCGRRVHLVWLPGMANLIWLDGVLALNHPRISAHF